MVLHPSTGVISSANYEVRIGAEQSKRGESSGVEVTAEFVLSSFRDESVALPLPLNKVAVTSAMLGDATGIVRPTKQGGLEVVVPDRGQHVLTVKFLLPAELQTTLGEFSLPLKPVAAGQLTVTLPTQDDWVDLQLDLKSMVHQSLQFLVLEFQLAFHNILG